MHQDPSSPPPRLRRFAIGSLLVATALAACQPAAPIPDETEHDLASHAAHDVKAPVRYNSLDGLAWTQTSVEWKATSKQAYQLAMLQLDAALKDKTWTAAVEDQTGDFAAKPPAVILDVDETVLDNSPYQARLIRDNTTYQSDTWTAWCKEARAQPVPGALEFTKYAASKGVTVFYVTNRNHNVEEATRKNLANHGFPLDNKIDTILTKKEKKEWGSDKKPRRTLVANDFRVLLLVGDNLGDFVSKYKVSVADRQAIYKQHMSLWGTRWIMLPNTLYGSWETALFDHSYDHDDNAKTDLKAKSLRFE